MISWVKNQLSFWKKYRLNYRQRTLPINLDRDKYQMHKHCTIFIRPVLKRKLHENTVCVFLMWTIFPMEMDSIFKKKSVGVLGPLWNLSSRNRVTPVSIQDGV